LSLDKHCPVPSHPAVLLASIAYTRTMPTFFPLAAMVALVLHAGAVSLRVQEGGGAPSLPLELELGHTPLFVKWEDYLGNDLSDVKFVQVGGNCGTNTPECAAGGDPIWEYATRFGWKGVVVEPVPRLFEQLRGNYQPFPSITPLHGMVSDHAGVGKIVDFGEMSHEGNKGVDVDSYTLEGLWADKVKSFAGSKVDILVVDAEGNEPKILSGPIPEPRPKFILFEMSQLNGASKAQIDQNLVAHGYSKVQELKHMDPKGQTMAPQDVLYKLL